MSIVGPDPRRLLVRESDLIHHWASDDLVLDARSGQIASNLTMATAANLIGDDGATLAAKTGQPRWQKDASGALLRFPGTGDTVAWDVPFQLRAVSILVELIQPSAYPSAGQGLWYLGNDGVTGGRLYIDSSGTAWRLNFHDGTSAVTSAPGSAAANGDRVLLFGTLQDDGKVQLTQRIIASGSTSIGTQSGTKTLVALGTTTRIRLNGVGTANTINGISIRRAKLAEGIAWTMDSLLTRY